MKKILQVILLAVLSLQASAQDAPDWQAPNASGYENFTVMMVKIEEALKPYATNHDLLAVFVGDELRGLASPAVAVGSSNNDASTYVLKAFGNEADGTPLDITLKYYNAQLQKIFTHSCTIIFSSDNAIGVVEDFIPPFYSGGDNVMKGDATGDGAVDVSDYIAIANYIMGNIPSGFDEKAADVTGDGIIDVSDYIGVANIILYGNINGK